MIILHPVRPTYAPNTPAPNEWHRSGKYRRLPNGTEEKRCARCIQYMPATVDNFGKCSTSRDGKHDWCLTCAREYRLQRKRDRLTIVAAGLIVFGGYCAVKSDPQPLYPVDARIAQVAR
jgi:hypothetical protein